MFLPIIYLFTACRGCARTACTNSGLGYDFHLFEGGMPLKEIKQKPDSKKPKLLESAAKAPKTAMKDLWLKSKDKSISELKETPFASQRGESSNAPANSAGDQMLSGMETAAKKGANLTYRGGKKLAQTTARKMKEKRELSHTLSEAKNTGGKTAEAAKNTISKIRTKNTVAKSVKGKPQKAVKTASRSVKGVQQGAKGITESSAGYRKSGKGGGPNSSESGSDRGKGSGESDRHRHQSSSGSDKGIGCRYCSWGLGGCGHYLVDLFNRPDCRFLLRPVFWFGFHRNRHQRNTGGVYPQWGISVSHSGDRGRQSP